MDISILLSEIKGNINWGTITVLGLLIISEFIGANDKIEASSIYGVFKAMLKTLKEQVWPKTAIVPEVPPTV